MKRLTQDVFNQFSASSSKGLGLSAVFSKGFAAASVYGRALCGGDNEIQLRSRRIGRMPN